MKNICKSVMLILVILVSVVIANAQTDNDKIKLSVSFVNAEFKLNPANQLENLQGLSVDADAKIFTHGKVRLGGVFNYQRVGLDNSLTDPVDTYTVGPQLSVKTGPVEPFVSALFGVQTTYNNDEIFVRRYRVGVDIPLGNFFVRPFFTEWERTEGLFSPSVQRYGAGAGVRF